MKNKQKINNNSNKQKVVAKRKKTNSHVFALVMATITTAVIVGAYFIDKRANSDECYRTGEVVAIGQCDWSGLCGVLFKDITDVSRHVYLEQGLAKYPVIGGKYCMTKDLVKK